MTGPRPRFTPRLLSAAVAALLLVAAFPPFDLGAAAFASATVLVASLRGLTGRAGLATGSVFGLVFFGVLLAWLMRFGVIAWLPLVVLQALFPAAFGALAARASRWPFRARLVAIPVWWAALELVRSSAPFGGFAWGRLGTSQVDMALGRTARIGGVTLTGALVVVFGILAAEMLARPALRARLALAAAAVVVLPVLLPVGVAGPRQETLDVASVQANVPRDRFSTIGRVGGRVGEEDLVIIDNHLEVTQRLLLEEQPPQLVVWAENAFDRDPMRVPDRYGRATEMVRRLGTYLITGAILEVGERFSNTNLLIGPSGEQVARYDKMHLVPFGEYVPIPAARDWVPLLASEVPNDGVAGEGPEIFDLGAARVGSVICFESTDAPLVRANVRRGAELLVVATNNASFGTSPAAEQHVQQSRVRAIENGRAVVHTAIAGISAMILPDGTVLDSAPLFTPALLRARLPLGTGLTPYARYGGVMEGLVLVAGAVCALLVLRRRVSSEPA